MPRIGRYWEGHGGIYAGIIKLGDKDVHVIMCETMPPRDVIFGHAADFSVSVSDMFRDFRLPNRTALALIYANLRHMLADGWYWTDERYPADFECNWVVAFPYGRHADARRLEACKAIAVRFEPCA